MIEKITGGFVILILGLGLGMMVSPKPPVKHVTHTVTKVKTVTEKVPVAVPAHLPRSCLLAIQLAQGIADAGSRIDNVSNRQLDIISDGRIVLNQPSINALNRLETRQRKMQNFTIGAVQTIATTQVQYRKVAAQCRKQTR